MTDLFRFQLDLRGKGYKHVFKEDLTENTFALEASDVIVHDGKKVTIYFFTPEGKANGSKEEEKIKKKMKEFYGSNNE